MDVKDLFEKAEELGLGKLSLAWEGSDYCISLKEEHDKQATKFRVDNIDGVINWCEEWLIMEEEDGDLL